MVEEIKATAMGYSAAIISAIFMLVLSILGKLGIYTGAVNMMQEGHMFYSLSITGIITGMIEAAIIGFIFGYGLIYIYNKFI